MKSLKSKKGITLIALVITIIVLLILAGVSINAVIGENGIASKAKLAKEETAIAEDKEKINLAIAEYEMESIEDDSKSLEEFLKSQDWCEDAVFDDDSKMVSVTMVNGSKYEIEVSGNVNGKDEFDWDVILEKANANPDSYKHSDQLVSTYIAIGTDGKPVNMDLWNPTLLDDSTYSLGTIIHNEYSTTAVYLGEYVDGKIQGKVPQYIYNEATLKFEPVTMMRGTFNLMSVTNDLIYPPELPTTVYDIQGVFARSANLITMPKIPDGVKNMSYAFYKCKGLKGNIVIPSSVNNLDNAFQECANVSSIEVDEANEVYDSRDNCNAIIETSSNALIVGCNNSIIPNSVTTIGYMAFVNCDALTNITISNSVTTIDEWAFYDCKGLATITIPSSVTSIGDFAFYECTALDTVYFNQTTKPIFGSSCFKKSSGVKTTFYFKNSIVADAFTTDYYNSSYGTKSTNYNW